MTSVPVKVAGAVALGVGCAAVLAACTGGRRSGGDDGPMSELTEHLMRTLKPDAGGGLSVGADAVRRVENGAFDGARLLEAADAHAYGTPTIIDAARDVRGDGTATFNEIRHVVRHFDADASGRFEAAESRAFEGEVGIRWIPA